MTAPRVRAAALAAVVLGVAALVAAGSPLLGQRSTGSSPDPVIYHGSYVPLQQVTTTEAYRSELTVSFDPSPWRRTSYGAGLVLVVTGGGALVVVRGRRRRPA